MHVGHSKFCVLSKWGKNTSSLWLQSSVYTEFLLSNAIKRKSLIFAEMAKE